MANRIKCLALLPLALIASIGFAHYWLIEQGVHFKGLKVDFGAPPLRYVVHVGDSMQDGPAWRPGTTYYESNTEYEDEGDRKGLGLQAVHYMKIARRSSNKVLAAKAEKYAQVFIDSWYGSRTAFAYLRNRKGWEKSWSGYSGEDDRN